MQPTMQTRRASAGSRASRRAAVAVHCSAQPPVEPERWSRRQGVLAGLASLLVAVPARGSKAAVQVRVLTMREGCVKRRCRLSAGTAAAVERWATAAEQPRGVGGGWAGRGSRHGEGGGFS